MFRQIATAAVLIAMSGLFLVQTASAQSGAGRSLSQRLEQFRDDLLGDSIPDESSSEPGGPPPMTRRPIPAANPPLASPRRVPNTSSAGSDEQTPTLARRPSAAVDDEKPVRPTPTLARRPDPPVDTDEPDTQVARPAKKPAVPKAKPEATTAKTQGAKPKPAGGSSRRTAQPGYKPEKSPAAPVEVEEETQQPEPMLAKRPEPVRRSETSESASPRLARRSESEEPSPPPRLARSTRPELTGPAHTEPKSTPKSIERPKSNHAHEADVLFSSESPLLSVEASGPTKVLIGKPATFVVKLRNAGEVPANNVVVTVNLPPFAEVAEAAPTAGTTRTPPGTERVEPFEWRITKFEPHSRETLTLKIIPRKSNPIDLAVQWTCSPEVSQTLVEVQEPKLVMGLSGPSEVHYGQTKVYKLSISNPGNGDAENVMVSLLPIGRGAEGSASHKIGVLKAGQNKSIEVELTARQAGALTIRAQAYADGGLRAEASEPVLVRRASLKLDADGPKVKYAGTGGTYHVHVTNPGDATAENVQVSAILPPQAKYVSSNGAGHAEADRGKIVWSAGNIQPGGERMFEILCVLQNPGENRIQVLASGEVELSASAAVNTRVEALADLKLEIRDPQGPILLGEDAVFEVIVRNRGTKSAENIDLVVFFSEGLEAVSVQGGPHEIGKGQVTFKSIPTLAAGSETVLRVHAKADRPANHVFRAELVCESLQTKLAAEETTRFYGDEVDSSERHNEYDLQPVPKE